MTDGVVLWYGTIFAIAHLSSYFAQRMAFRHITDQIRIERLPAVEPYWDFDVKRTL